MQIPVGCGRVSSDGGDCESLGPQGDRNHMRNCCEQPLSYILWLGITRRCVPTVVTRHALLQDLEHE